MKTILFTFTLLAATCSQAFEFDQRLRFEGEGTQECQARVYSSYTSADEAEMAQMMALSAQATDNSLSEKQRHEALSKYQSLKTTRENSEANLTTRLYTSIDLCLL
ncbi:MAG: hypothetical protein AAGB31_00495 [Bdellovibrio sp.]